jgi:hypothetical protein
MGGEVNKETIIRVITTLETTQSLG